MDRTGEQRKLKRRGMLLRVVMTLVWLCVIAAVAGLMALRRFRLPAPTGPYAVGTSILNMTDASRREDGSADGAGQRELVVQLWYPAEASSQPIAAYKRWRETTLSSSYEALLRTNSRMAAPIASAGAPFAVLLFGHRWAGERTQNTDLAEELASHGYVVAAVDHPFNSSRVLVGDGRVVVGDQPLEGPRGYAATAQERIDYWNQQLEVWAADDLFVLNELARMNAGPDAMHGRLDTDKVGAFGHSFGGAVSLRLCGMDPRIKAAVNLDGWTFGALAQRTTQPVMVEYEKVSAAPAGTVEGALDRADDAVVDASLQRYGGYRLHVAGTQHLDFTDQPLLPPLHRGSFTGPIAPRRIESIVRESVLEFFDQSLRGKSAGMLQAGQTEFGEVTVEAWPMR